MIQGLMQLAQHARLELLDCYEAMPVQVIVLDEGDPEDMRANWDDVVGGGLGA
jgi:hypothetical protein